MDQLLISARTSEAVKLPCSSLSEEEVNGFEAWLTLEFKLKNDTVWGPQVHTICCSQLCRNVLVAPASKALYVQLRHRKSSRLQLKYDIRDQGQVYCLIK